MSRAAAFALAALLALACYAEGEWMEYYMPKGWEKAYSSGSMVWTVGKQRFIFNVSENGIASEDFAIIAEKIPSAFLYLSAGYLDERGQYGAHHPKVQFNEDVCPMGAACMAHCAVQWL